MKALTTQYTQNVIQDNRAVMLLFDYIGYDSKTGVGIRGSYFAEEMYYHKQNGREITVYINSPGGSVYDGFNIIQAIIDTEADTHIVGMAASMAGIVAQFGKNRTMNDFAIGMIHAVSGTNDKLITITQEQLRECLMKRSKLTEKQINKLMVPGEDNWLDSSEMLEKGLVDEVIVTGKNITNEINLKIINEKVLNVNDSFKIYQNIVNALNTQPTPDNMPDFKAVGAELGIENATEETAVSKIKEIKNTAAEAVTLKTKLTDAEAAKLAAETAKTTAENTLKEERKQRSTELVENAILAGKIKEESKADYISLAESNYDLAKKTLNGIQAGGTVHNSVHNAIGNNTSTGSVEEDYESLAQNNPAKLQEIFNKEPEKFKKLEAAYLAKSKSK